MSKETSFTIIIIYYIILLVERFIDILPTATNGTTSTSTGGKKNTYYIHQHILHTPQNPPLFQYTHWITPPQSWNISDSDYLRRLVDRIFNYKALLGFIYLSVCLRSLSSPLSHFLLVIAMQSQLVCSGCRSILLYPRGATNVCCALCSAITAVPPPAGFEMSQLICGGCRTLLMYTRGASSVRCSCCHTVNIAPATGQLAHVNCGNCRTTLMYPYGAPSVKCAVCQYITNVNIGDVRVPISVHRPNATSTSSTAMPRPQSQTVVIENPMSVDESGKLVSNVVVGVTTEKK